MQSKEQVQQRFQDTPEEVAGVNKSYTGQYLRQVLGATHLESSSWGKDAIRELVVE